MTSPDLHSTLLRPAILQILRAAGFNSTRPAVLDVVTDLAARYLLLLSSSTAQHAYNTHQDPVPTVQDVRLALQDAGALRPMMSVLEELAKGVERVNGDDFAFEDMRGVDAFVSWAQGGVNKEIRRIAGFEMAGDVVGVDAATAAALEDDGEMDYVTALKKKHSKTGEESRYQGSILGKDAEAQGVVIMGGPASNISEWGRQVISTAMAISPNAAAATPATNATSGISSAPLTPMEEAAAGRSEVEIG